MIARSSRRLIGASIVSFFFLMLGLWQLTYHGRADRKDLRYQAWKLGLYPMNPEHALETMVGDVYPDRIVLGKTKAELERRFGYITPVREASAYVQYCYFNSPYYGREAFVLRNSNWMVLMKQGRVDSLVLVKGC